MATFESLANKKRELVRKALGGAVFIAPASAARIATGTHFTGTDSTLTALPVAFTDGGLISDDGIEIARELDTSDIAAWGENEPVRTDFTSDVSSAQVAFIETNRIAIQLYTGATDADLVPVSASGEVSFVKPAARARFVQAVIISVDRTDDGDIYIGRYWPSAEATDFDSQTFSSGDDPVGWTTTLSAKRDDTLGYSERFFFGGPGWKALLVSMGFTDEVDPG